MAPISSGPSGASTGVCRDFEPGIPGNRYSFCKFATFWIDGQGGRTSPMRPCPHTRTYGPGLHCLFCHRSRTSC